MNLGLFNYIVNTNNHVQSFIKDLQNYLDNKKEDTKVLNTTHNESKIITEFRDRMLIERSNILNNYAKDTLNKGTMLYIYSKNSKLADGFNLCICEEGKSHVVIELSKDKLSKNANIGSVLRQFGNDYILDQEATNEVAIRIENMKNTLLKEQAEFLDSKRIEGHIYEISEKGDDRAWLFDVTSGSNEAIEEISFPEELLKNSKEGDLFVYKNGEYVLI